MESGMVRLLLYHWAKPQISIGNMKRNDAARRKMPLVKLEGLRRKEMNGNRIAGKCVHGNYVIILRRLRFHGKPGISMRNLYLGSRFTQVCEHVLRDDLHARVNLIKPEHVSRLSVSRQGPGSQADVGHTAWSALATVVQRQA